MSFISDASVQEESELLLEVPSVQPYSSVYYTLPFINSKFPEIFDYQTLPKLHLSARCDDGNHSRSPWSVGIDLLSENHIFVIIPLVADVKVHVDQTMAITCVRIDPVSKAEVSAKEIRSRINGKETTVILAEEKPMTGPSVGCEKELPHVARQRSVRKMPSQKKTNTDLSIGVFVKHLCLIVQSSSIENVSEILRLSIDNCIVCSYPITPRDSSQNAGRRLCIGICLGDLQIDNQQQGVGPYDFPVALIKQAGVNVTPNIDNIAELNILEKHAVLRSCCFTHIQVVLGTNPRLQHTMIESIDISVKPVSLYIDDGFIYFLLKEMEGFIPTTLSHDSRPPIRYQKLPRDIKCAARLAGSPIKIHHLCIQPINVLLSVHASMMMFIASDHTPLSFGKFERLNLCTSGHQLTRALTMHYVSGAIFRAGNYKCEKVL